ncbi:MAG TPA: bifunctional enoyl-CoA hydratase/phosphate acetyltransferase [Verrucomicrobiae bacterium]|nr:bifunctional enoyl-CoA hydratase/phosphate acetyltransferase [Verrucomicrobiae bacterium]
MITTFKELVERARELPRAKLSVAAACDREVLEGVKLAVEAGVADPILVGDQGLIESIGVKIGLDLHKVEIVHEEDPVEAARIAVKLVQGGSAQVVMKGMVDSASFMRAVLDEEIGLRTGSILSHLAVYEVPGRDRLIFMSDGGINIAPNLEHKVQILRNSVTAIRALGIPEPRVAVMAAVEVVNPKMQATLDAAELVRRNQAGEFPGVYVAGPYALDIAIDAKSAAHKNINGPVAGQADLLLMPNIETGNIFGKGLVYFAGGTMAGVVLGPSAPVILTSRNDPPQAKLASIALAMIISQAN